MINRLLSQAAKDRTEVPGVRRHHDPLLGNRNGPEFNIRQLLKAGVVNCTAHVETIGREDVTNALTGVVFVQKQPDQYSATSMFSSGYLACQYSTG